jgi:hypothetical protein
MRSLAANVEDIDITFYMRALVAVAAVDGMSDAEADYIRSRSQMLGIDSSTLLSDPPPITAVSGTASEITKRLVYRDCYVLASIDGPPSAKERAVLADLCDALGLAAGTAERIEDWMNRFSSLLTEGEALLVAE